MVMLMLAILLGQAVTGLFADDEISTQGPLAAKASNAWVARMTMIHQYNGWAIASAAAIHIAAVAVYRWGWKDDLLSPMLHGWKSLPADVRPPAQASSLRALALAAAAAAFVYWLVVLYPTG
jgi:cytochrome b